MAILSFEAGYEKLNKIVPFAKFEIVREFDEVWAAAHKIGFPVVLKLLSEKIVHKTEAGAIAFASNLDELEEAFKKLSLLAKKFKTALKILVQEKIKGLELAIGIKRDQTFGPAIMFGIGGIAIELLKDVSFRICPIVEKDVEEMIDELKTKALLFGFRGAKPINLELIKKILIQLSLWALKQEEVLELDINPLIVNETAKAVDVRMVLKD